MNFDKLWEKVYEVDDTVRFYRKKFCDIYSFVTNKECIIPHMDDMLEILSISPDFEVRDSAKECFLEYERNLSIYKYLIELVREQL